MFDKMISIAPAALRSATKAGPVGAIRSVQPVVQRPAQSEPVKQATSYTPQNAKGKVEPLYSPKGTPSYSSSVFQAATYDRTDTFDLQVRTAEGDIATLSFSQDEHFSTSFVSQQAASGAVQALSAQALQASGFHMGVQGSLNTQEAAAVNALAQQVSEVADDFFGGDMEAALQNAARIDISTQADTLSEYAFSLQTTQTQLAAAVYEDVALSTSPLDVRIPQPELMEPPLPPPPPASGNGKSDFLKNLLALFEGFTRSVKELTQPVAATNTRTDQVGTVIDV